jgi:hypothetical protein
MFRRFPGYQTPSWFVALLFVAGFILDFQRVSPASLDDHEDVRENSRRRVTTSEVLHPLRRDSSMAEK